jgi:hypothetical protein
MNNLTEKQLAELKAQEDEARMEERYNKLKNRFQNNLPFIVKNKNKRTMALVISYIANILSIAGLMYVVIVMFEALPMWVRVTMALLVLIGFEKLKRHFSDDFWDEYYSANNINYKIGFVNFIILGGISLLGTTAGLYFLSEDTDPGAAALRVKIEQVQADIHTHENNKNSKR